MVRILVKIVATARATRLVTKSFFALPPVRIAARAEPRRADLGTMGRRRSDIEEDGYVWHKYGAKNVRGRKVGYFKCAHRGCEARKKVWRQANGDEAVELAGTHTHAAGEAVRLEEVGEISTDNADAVPMPVNRAARGGQCRGWLGTCGCAPRDVRYLRGIRARAAAGAREGRC